MLFFDYKRQHGIEQADVIGLGEPPAGSAAAEMDAVDQPGLPPRLGAALSKTGRLR